MDEQAEMAAAAKGRPRFWGSLAYLGMNFPLGIILFVGLVTLTAVGLGTAVIWVGLPLLALVVAGSRGIARLERARVYALLDTYIQMPYRPLPESGQRDRWMTRVRDAATSRDVLYLLLLLPLGILEFTLLVAAWSVTLALVAMPIYFRFLPDGVYYFPSEDYTWLVVDSTMAALPWAVLGLLFVPVSMALTKALATMHAGIATRLLGPTSARMRQFMNGDLASEPSRRPAADAVAGW